MAYPDKPQILTSYTAAEQSLGDGSLPGQELDTDLANLQLSTEQIIDFLKLFTRSDGKLANGIVTSESLAASLRIGFDPPEVWTTGRAYTTRSTAFQGFGFYLCTTAHTSGVFATDLAAGRWQLLADLTPPGGALIASNNLSDLADVATARTNFGLGTMATAVAGTAGTQFRTNDENDARFQPADSDLTAIAGLSANGIVARTGAGTAAARAITGTANQIAVANGDGVSGNPTVSAVVASQAEAEAGTDTTRLMTPQRVEQHMRANALGWDQVWANQVRALATNYTNTTGRPIQISVRLTLAATTGSGGATLTIAGVDVSTVTLGESTGAAWNATPNTISAIIPPGAVYAITGANAAIISWSELR